MSLRDEMDMIVKAYECHRKDFDHNHALIDIFEGNLLDYVLADLKAQLSQQSFDQCKQRVPPINVLTKIIDKMSTIYQPPPVRRIAEGTGSPGDQELLAWYLEKMKPNDSMQKGLELFNLCKGQLMQPFVHESSPCLRAMPNDRFFVIATDRAHPQYVTHVVTFDCIGQGKVIFTAYTENEILIFNEKSEVQNDAMMSIGNPEGINPYQRIPFVYKANARFHAMPTQDTDIFQMTKLVPVLMADLNYAVMFQSFAIIYGINVDDENLKMAPNSFWRFKSDTGTEGKPEIGVIKPQVDIAQVMSLIQSELALWLNTKGIRPGAVGKLEADQFASGISKLIDEMDTVEIRQKLVEVEAQAEADMWDLIMHSQHPYWVQMGMIENKALFSPGAKVEVVFAPQLPMTSRGQVVKDQEAEVSAGFTTRRRAIKTLNPSMAETEVDELIKDIRAEGGAADPAAAPGKGGNADGPDAPAEDDAPGDAGEADPVPLDPEAPIDIAAAAAADANVQTLSLNGSQIESILTIAERVRTGALAKKSAKAIMQAAFSTITEAKINEILDPIEVVGATPAPPSNPPPGQKVPPPAADDETKVA